MNHQNPVGEVQIYACGGGGTNICAMYSDVAELGKSSAVIHTAFIDTSDSNLRKRSLPVDEVFFIKKPDDLVDADQIDGSGKVRDENAQYIIDAVPRILHAHPPRDVNIVVATAAGGSGSVIAPTLAYELLERGKDVVLIIVGVIDDDITIENTLGTIKSLESTVDDLQRVVNTRFIMHRKNDKREDINKRAQFFISSLCVLASRQNDELDTRDLSRWLNYNTVPRANLKPALTLVDCFLDPNQVEKEAKNTFAMAMVLKDTDQEKPDVSLAYHGIGYLPEDGSSRHNLYFTSDVSGWAAIRQELNTELKAVNERRSIREAGARFNEGGTKGKKGLVL